MKTAVLTVIYPEMEKWLPEFISSLEKQTDLDFDLIVLNHGMNSPETYFKQCSLRIEIQNAEGTPTGLRKKMIRKAIKENYEALIFADSDDTFSSNRIAKCKEWLKQYPVVFNELMLMGDAIETPTPMLGPRLKDQQVIDESFIKESNCLGLSNTAIMTHCIQGNIDSIPDSIVAFDWAFFTYVLHNEIKAVFISEAQTFYRQHDKNAATPFTNSEELVLKVVKVKADHYQALSTLGEDYRKRAADYRIFQDRINQDAEFKSQYISDSLKEKPQHPFWWESIERVGEKL